MAIVTEVTFAHEDGALVDTFTANPELDATVVGDARTEPGETIYLIQFGSSDLEYVRAALEDDHSVAAVKRVEWFAEQQILGVEFAPDAKLLNPVVTARNGLVLKARSNQTYSEPRGWHERWLLPDDSALQEIWQSARDQGFQFDIVDLEQPSDAGPGVAETATLTAEQRAGLVTAYERGYFTEPRETGLDDLAADMGLSTTAVGGRIKRGMKALILQTLIQNDQVR
jgi:hypothetical protein